MLNFLTVSPITGFEYYTAQQGQGFTLYVKLEGRHNTGIVSERAFRELPVGELKESLRIRGVKGAPNRLAPFPVNGFLPIAFFDGKNNPQEPRLQQRY